MSLVGEFKKIRGQMSYEGGISIDSKGDLRSESKIKLDEGEVADLVSWIITMYDLPYNKKRQKKKSDADIGDEASESNPT